MFPSLITLLALSLLPFVFSYSNSVPVVAWSSSDVLDGPTTFDTILTDNRICDHDAVVLVQQPGLHASDLRTLSPKTHLARSLSSSHSARQFPYVQEFDVASLAESISNKCQSRLLQYALGDAGVVLEHDIKHVVSLDMPHLLDTGKSRKDAMTRHESILGHELSALMSAFPSHLVIYAGSLLPAHSKRQLDEIMHAPANTTLPDGGILKRYQLLTPGLITILLVTFFLLIPLVMFGINALASIQNPLRIDTPKGFNAQDKKNQ